MVIKKIKSVIGRKSLIISYLNKYDKEFYAVNTKSLIFILKLKPNLSLEIVCNGTYDARIGLYLFECLLIIQRD